MLGFLHPVPGFLHPVPLIIPACLGTMRCARLACVAVLLAASLLAAPMVGRAQFGKRTDSKEPAVNSDIPFIKCQVCEAIAKQAHRAVKDLRATKTGKHKLSGAGVQLRV